MPDTTPPSDMPEFDGRKRRSQNNKEKIINATFSLCDKGNLVPTAQEIANESGISLRTVFRHFSDMETVFTEMNKTLYTRVAPLFSSYDTSGTLEDRLADLVNRRADLYEGMGPYLLSTIAQKWRYDVLAKNYNRVLRDLRDQRQTFIPELDNAPLSDQIAFDNTLSFENWDRCRTHHGMSRKQAASIVYQSALKILS